MNGPLESFVFIYDVLLKTNWLNMLVVLLVGGGGGVEQHSWAFLDKLLFDGPHHFVLRQFSVASCVDFWWNDCDLPYIVTPVEVDTGQKTWCYAIYRRKAVLTYAHAVVSACP